ncbi:hypothetical protein BD324DRAFT_670875 [Kockovaella imperatae]|uniref:F-box domain-containing protein n=1 Tax=Kockovaella imperatae TaxID=4999 RepID=A0A1Y1UK29_9TREE|nr:hypothetical protein BD324DRAFT_670875 [Kockovaella imperatae]ORX38349.1 hypothetical protein BD324DRAFT_670875 [Kockovaella imperatae]
MQAKPKLLDLPPEVLASIASRLDTESARSLAVTHKILRRPAESRLWRRVSVSGDHRCECRSQPPHWIHMGEDRWGLLPDEIYHRVRSPGPRIAGLTRVLSSCSWRSLALRRIELQLYPEVPEELVPLFRHAPGLTDLILRVKPTDMVVLPAKGLLSTTQLFESIGAMSNLERAEIHIQHLRHRTLASFLSNAPELKHLSLTLFPLHLSELPFTPKRERSRPVTLPVATQLLTLIFNPRTTDMPFVTEIVKRSPSLANVALKDDGVSWNPHEHPDFWTALGACRIEKLEVTSKAVEMVTGQLFPLLRDLQVNWDFATGNADGAASNDKLGITSLPSLQTYRIRVLETGRPQDDFTLYTSSLQMWPSTLWCKPLHEVLKCLSNEIKATARLDSLLYLIEFPQGPSFTTKDPWSVADGPVWGDVDFNGWRIRSFVDARDQGLFHICSTLGDSLTSRTGNEEGQLSECVFFQGEEIPLSVLRAMLAADGKENILEDRRRSIRLGSAGWAVLDRWKLESY